MKYRPGKAAGFTLLEVILAIGMLTVLLAALYQTLSTHIRAQDQTTAELRRVLRARGLLHRIAEELRSVPAVPGEMGSNSPSDAPQARKLLSLGRTAVDDPLAQLDSLAADGGRGEVSLAPESFALLGQTDRLLLRTQVNVVPRPLVEAAAAVELPPVEELRPRSSIRLVTYALRRPAALPQATPAAPAKDSQETSAIEPEEQPILPATLVRLEVLHPLAASAMMQARQELETFFSAENSAATGSASTPPVVPPTQNNPGAEPVQVVRLQEIADDIVDLRIRYSDGGGWSDRWDDARRLPVAVEIAVRLVGDVEEELAGDFADTMPSLATPLQPTGATGLDSLLGKRWFPHRLVVALPSSAQSPRWTPALSDLPGATP